MTTAEVELLSEEGAKIYLTRLIERLDNLDADDFFGSEGWRRYVMGED